MSLVVGSGESGAIVLWLCGSCCLCITVAVMCGLTPGLMVSQSITPVDCAERCLPCARVSDETHNVKRIRATFSVPYPPCPRLQLQVLPGRSLCKGRVLRVPGSSGTFCKVLVTQILPDSTRPNPQGRGIPKSLILHPKSFEHPL